MQPLRGVGFLAALAMAGVVFWLAGKPFTGKLARSIPHRLRAKIAASPTQSIQNIKTTCTEVAPIEPRNLREQRALDVARERLSWIRKFLCMVDDCVGISQCSDEESMLLFAQPLRNDIRKLAWAAADAANPETRELRKEFAALRDAAHFLDDAVIARDYELTRQRAAVVARMLNEEPMELIALRVPNKTLKPRPTTPALPTPPRKPPAVARKEDQQPDVRSEPKPAPNPIAPQVVVPLLVSPALRPSRPAAPHLMATIRGHDHPVFALNFDPSGHRLTAVDSVKIGLWDTRAFELSEANEFAFDMIPELIPQIMCVAFAADGKNFALGGVDKTLWLRELAREGSMLEFRRARCATGILAFSPDGQQLAAADKDGGISIWDARSREFKRTWSGHQGEITSIVFRSDAKHLATAGHDWTIRIWDASDGRETDRIALPEVRLRRVTFSPFASRLARYSTSEIEVWQTKPLVLVWKCSMEDKEHIAGLTFDHLSERVATVHSDGAIRIWGQGGELLSWVAGEPLLIGNGRQALAFSPNGHYLAIATASNSVQLWNVSATVSRR